MLVLHTYYTDSRSDPRVLVRVVTPDDFYPNQRVYWSISEVERWQPADDSYMPASSHILAEIAGQRSWERLHDYEVEIIKQTINMAINPLGAGS